MVSERAWRHSRGSCRTGATRDPDVRRGARRDRLLPAGLGRRPKRFDADCYVHRSDRHVPWCQPARVRRPDMGSSRTRTTRGTSVSPQNEVATVLSGVVLLYAAGICSWRERTPAGVRSGTRTVPSLSPERRRSTLNLGTGLVPRVVRQDGRSRSGLWTSTERANGQWSERPRGAAADPFVSEFAVGKIRSDGPWQGGPGASGDRLTPLPAREVGHREGRG